jgi:hypothetical protein
MRKVCQNEKWRLIATPSIIDRNCVTYCAMSWLELKGPPHHAGGDNAKKNIVRSSFVSFNFCKTADKISHIRTNENTNLGVQ